MTERIQIDDVTIEVWRKRIKNIHLAVLPPDASVRLSVPIGISPDVVRSFVVMKLPWIHLQQEKLRAQERESPRKYVTRESLHVFGRRYLLEVQQTGGASSVAIQNGRIILGVKDTADRKLKAKVIHAWHKRLLHDLLPPLIRKWEQRTGVKSSGYSLRKMKTKWGSCNAKTGHLLFNTELVQKPHSLIEYVVVHELLHIIEPSHNHRFTDLLDRYYQHWQEARAELNALPLTSFGHH